MLLLAGYRLGHTMAVYGGRWDEVRNLGGGGQGLTVLMRDRSGVEPTECVLKRLKNVEQ